MRKQIPIVFASTLFLCGLLAGLLARSDSHAQQPSVAKNTNDSLRTVMAGLLARNPAKISDRTGGLAAETIIELACLQRLRGGETNEAIAMLEQQIDSNIGLLADGLSLIPSAERDPRQLQVIRSFRHYRRQFPLTNSPAYPFKTTIPSWVKEGIARAYALVPEENEKP
jgi:hypothetical protein